MTSQKYTNLQITLALLLLAAGGMIYMLYGNEQLLGFRVADALGISTIVDAMREAARQTTPPEFVRYSLPDGLWSASYVLFADCFTRGESLKKRLATAALIPALGVASELMQLAGMLQGVYDTLDLISYIIPYLLYYLYERFTIE